VNPELLDTKTRSDRLNLDFDAKRPPIASFHLLLARLAVMKITPNSVPSSVTGKVRLNVSDLAN